MAGLMFDLHLQPHKIIAVLVRILCLQWLTSYEFPSSILPSLSKESLWMLFDNDIIVLWRCLDKASRILFIMCTSSTEHDMFNPSTSKSQYISNSIEAT